MRAISIEPTSQVAVMTQQSVALGGETLASKPSVCAIPCSSDLAMNLPITIYVVNGEELIGSFTATDALPSVMCQDLLAEPSPSFLLYNRSLRSLCWCHSAPTVDPVFFRLADFCRDCLAKEGFVLITTRKVENLSTASWYWKGYMAKQAVFRLVRLLSNYLYHLITVDLSMIVPHAYLYERRVS